MNPQQQQQQQLQQPQQQNNVPVTTPLKAQNSATHVHSAQPEPLNHNANAQPPSAFQTKPNPNVIATPQPNLPQVQQPRTVQSLPPSPQTPSQITTLIEALQRLIQQSTVYGVGSLQDLQQV